MLPVVPSPLLQTVILCLGLLARLGLLECLVHDLLQDESTLQESAGSPQTVASSLFGFLWQVVLPLGCSHDLSREKGLGAA